MEPEEHESAACFDFDGLFFQENAGWKVRRAGLGVVGSRMPAHEAYAAFRKIREAEPDAEVDDYFALDEYEMALANPKDTDRNRNLLPSSRLLHYAHHHLFRRSELVVTAPPGFFGLIREMTDRAFARLDTFLMFENPFHRAVRRYPFEFADFDAAPGSEERLAVQVAFYASFLKFDGAGYATEKKLRARFGLSGRGYEKIYLYHTQPELETRIRAFLAENPERFVGGRNAIVPLYIADVPPDGPVAEHPGASSE